MAKAAKHKHTGVIWPAKFLGTNDDLVEVEILEATGTEEAVEKEEPAEVPAVDLDDIDVSDL